MPKAESEKKSNKSSGWGNGQLFGTEATETTFQGAGFRDKEKALETIRLLDGRDTTYQFQIINSMYNRAKVIYRRTTDKDKRQNLNEAIETFENWIDDYKTKSRSKENFTYLPLEVLEAYKPLADHYQIPNSGFLDVYTKAGGDLKVLRSKTVPDKNITWDIERNNNLKFLSKKMKEEFISLFETDEPFRGLPTKEHVQMIMWGFSSDLTKIKKCLPLIKEKL